MASKPDGPAQDFETRFAERVVAYRWPVIVIALVLVAAAAAGGMSLRLSTDYRMFFDKDNPELLALESLEATYSKTDNILFMIVPDDGDATSKPALETAVWLTDRAWQTPYSTRVDSIANFQHTTANGDDLLVRNLVDPAMLGDREHLTLIRAIALADPRLVGNLLSRDGSVSAVNVNVELAAENHTARVPEIAKFARDLAIETEERFPGIDIRVVGTVMISHAFSEASLESQLVFLPASLAIMALVLTLITRRLAGVAATGMVIVLSVATAMGLGGWAGVPLSPDSAPAPTIVLMIVVANCVHLLITQLQRMQAGDTRAAAVVESVRVNLYPVFLASLTTMLGFLAMNFSEVPPHRHLGTFVAFGIMASFLLSVTFLPAILSLLPMRAPKARPRRRPHMTLLAGFVVRRRQALLLGSTAVVLVLLAAIPRNELNDVLVNLFAERVEFRQDIDFLDERLSGNTVLEYSLVSSGPGGIAEPAFLADVSAFSEWYRAQPETRHVTSITDTFRQLNKSMHVDDPAFYRLPESRDLASQYLLLYELSLPFGLDLNNQIDVDKSATRMTVTATTLSSADVLALNQRAEAWLAANAPNIVEADGSGAALMFAHIGQRNIRAMLVGTAIVLGGISALLLVAFRSLRLGLVSLVPNFVPAVIGFGIWGLTVGEVGVALSVVVAMTVGIVVDDTVHFLSKYQRARREHGYTSDEAVRYAFKTVGQAVFTTTSVLVSGFLILLLSPFIPTAQVGLLTAMIIAFAMIADFFLLPPLLMAVDRCSGNPGPRSSTAARRTVPAEQ